MALTNEYIDLIEWLDESRDTIVYRFPDEDRAIKRGAQLIVRESQAAQFVYLGEFGDTFGPGKHRLVTDNLPLLSRIRGWKYGFETPFKADVYYVTTRLFTGNRWGTANPVMLRDPDLNVVRVRAFGTYDFRVRDPRRFLGEVAGTDDRFTLDDFAHVMRSRLVGAFSRALAESGIPVLDAAARYGELGEALLPLINPALSEKYGVEIPAFVVENISVPPEVEQAIDKRSGMSAVQNLDDYVKYQLGQGLERGSGGAAGVGAEVAVGMSVARQMLGSPGAPPVAAVGVVDVLTPAQVAQMLAVSEADVIKTLEAGELKGRKIGFEWRVAREAIEQFLK
jgi:excisionase family DNA binding protein